MTIILSLDEKEYLQGVIEDMPKDSQGRLEAERLIEAREDYDEMEFWSKYYD